MPTIIIQKGDTLGALAQKYGTSVSDLIKLNPSISNPDLISAGASLAVPDTAATPSIDTTAKTLPGDKTLTPDVPVVKTLPNTPSSNLAAFASVLTQATTLAKKKRQELGATSYAAAVPEGALPASSFADFVSTVDKAGQDFQKPIVTTAIDAFKSDQSLVKDNKTKIQALADAMVKKGVEPGVVQKILNNSDYEQALIQAAPYFKSGVDTVNEFTNTEIQDFKAAGIENNTDPNVKKFYANTPTAFRAEIARRNAAGDLPSIDITSIGTLLNEWQAKQKKKNDISGSLDALFQ